MPNLCVCACVKCFVWLHKIERETEYIVNKATKFQPKKYVSLLKIFIDYPRRRKCFTTSHENFPNYSSVQYLTEVLRT